MCQWPIFSGSNRTSVLRSSDNKPGVCSCLPASPCRACRVAKSPLFVKQHTSPLPWESGLGLSMSQMSQYVGRLIQFQWQTARKNRLHMLSHREASGTDHPVMGFGTESRAVWSSSTDYKICCSFCTEWSFVAGNCSWWHVTVVNLKRWRGLSLAHLRPSSGGKRCCLVRSG